MRPSDGDVWFLPPYTGKTLDTGAAMGILRRVRVMTGKSPPLKLQRKDVSVATRGRHNANRARPGDIPSTVASALLWRESVVEARLGFLFGVFSTERRAVIMARVSRRPAKE